MTGNPGVYLTEARWMNNNAGVKGTVRPGCHTGINNWIPTPISVLPVFRIFGTPLTVQPVQPSYSSYAAPDGWLATVYLEVVCPILFRIHSRCPSLCRSLQHRLRHKSANSWPTLPNACLSCPCWGGAGCPSSPAPYGFHADCSGSVLRVGNSTAGLCTGAFVCADHVDGLTKYSAKKQLDSVARDCNGDQRGGDRSHSRFHCEK